MEETQGFFDIIKEAFAHGYWKGVLILIVVMLFFILYKTLQDSDIKQAIRDWFRRKTYSFNEAKLNSHPYFQSQPKLKYKVCNLNFPNAQYKTLIFRVLLGTELSVGMEVVKEFVTHDFKKVTADELFTKQIELLESAKKNFDTKVIPELESVCERELAALLTYDDALAKKSKCAREIFHYVMYTTNGYDAARNRRTELLVENMEMLRDSITFQSSNERNYFFLEILSSFTSQAILRAEQDFRGFNGEIEKIFANSLK